MAIKVKRASEPAAHEDGARVLVDRYWPRGVQRGDAHIDAWSHDVAPSPTLIAWYGHKRERWDEFKRRYCLELASPRAAATLQDLKEQSSAGHLTLVYGSRDRDYNGARVLAEYLEGLPKSEGSPVSDTPRPGAVRPPIATRPQPPAQWRIRVPALFEWTWMLVGLGTPLILLAIGEALVIWGRHAAVAIVTILACMCASTVLRANMHERREREALGMSGERGEGAVSILAPIQELGLSVVGFILGFAALVFALVFVTGLNHLFR